MPENAKMIMKKIYLRVGSAKHTNYVFKRKRFSLDEVLNKLLWSILDTHESNPTRICVSFREQPASSDLSHMNSFISDGKQCFEDHKIRLLDVWKNKSLPINTAPGPH